jgi:cobalt-zinc-cadmium efflux system membrane fusion protein
VKRIIVLIIAILALAGCEKNEPPKVEAKVELKTFKVSAQKVQAFVDATGTVQPDMDGAAKILTPLAGSVEKILVRIGDGVKQGTPLALMRSSDVSDAYAGHLSALAQLKQAERSDDLNKKLFEIGAVTKNDLLTSEANYEQSKAVVEGLKRKLDIYGSSRSGGGQGNLTIRSPIAGNVVEMQAHVGDRFDTNTPLMIVANPNRSLIVANIYDTDVAKVHTGSTVTFTTDVFPAITFKGTISYVSDVEDPDSKTIKTYIRLIGRTTMLKQNMFLKIRILDGERLLPVIAKSAMIYKEGKFYVQLKTPSGFELREIKPLRDISEKYSAVEGLKDGDLIANSAMDKEQP